MKSLQKLDGINESEEFLSLVQKQEITHVIFIDQPDENKLKFVTTTDDGFIKTNELDLAANKLKKVK